MTGARGNLLGRRGAALVFLALLFLRVSVAAQFRGNYDTESFLIVANAVLQGQNVYDATDRYNYGPPWAYLLASLWAVAGGSVDVFILLVGVFLTAVDAVSAFLVMRIASDRLGLSPPEARRAALLFFANPVSVLVSGAHGQFDGLSILFLLAAIFAAPKGGTNGKPWTAAAWLGASLIVKHLTIFHPLLFWRRIRKPALPDAALVATYALFFAAFLPFASAWPSILRNVFLYSSGVEPGRARPGGLQTYIALEGAPRALYSLVLVAAVTWVLAASRHMELPRACLLLSLATLVFLPGFSDQSLVWPVALGALYPGWAFGVFSAAGGLWYSAGSLRLPLPVWTNAQAAWVAGLLWFAVEAVRARSRRNR